MLDELATVVSVPKSYNDIAGKPDSDQWYSAVHDEPLNMERMHVWSVVSTTAFHPAREQSAVILSLTSNALLTARSPEKLGCARTAPGKYFQKVFSAFSSTRRPQTFRASCSKASYRKLRIHHFDIKSASLVDDILIAHHADDGSVYAKIAAALQRMFRIKSLVLEKFLGTHLSQDEDFTVSLDQSHYSEELLLKYNMAESAPVATPLVAKCPLPKVSKLPATSFPYRECIGALWYLVVHTRPDLAQPVGYLSRFVAAPTDQHTTELKRLLRYLRGTVNLGLRFDSKCLQPPVLVSYTDSDYGGDKNDYKSTSGFLAMLKSGSYEHVLDWHSRKQAAVSRSSCESEFIALGQASAELLWLRGLLMELKLLTTSTTILTVPDTAVVKVHLDSSSAKQLAENEGYTGKTRHIGIQFYFVRDLVETGIISLTWVPSHQQLADAFTKPLDEAAFVRFQRAVMFRFEARRVS